MADSYRPPGSTAPPAGKKRDPLSIAGMVAVAAAAAFTSYSGLVGLAEMAGWPHQLALMLPVTVDAYAMTATRVWLSPAKLTKKARSWARGNAIGAIATSVLGNTIFHAASAHVLEVTWPVVVGISAIPSIVLGLTVHLWHTANDTEPETKQSPGPAIAGPDAVNAAYPILGTTSTGAPAGPPPVGAKPAAKATAPAPTGGPHRNPPQTPPVGAGKAPTARPQRPAPQQRAAPGGEAPKVLSDEELLAKARELAAELGATPSANQLHLRLSIGPNRARRLADQLAAEPTSTPTPTRRAEAANPLPARQSPTGGVARSAVSAADATPPVAATPAPASSPEPTAPNHPGPPTDPDPHAPGGTLPAQRPAPVERANGAGIPAP